MTQEQPAEKPKLTRPQIINQVRQNMLNTWLRNLMAETALPIMGHILLGQVFQDNPDLNNKNRYIQFGDADTPKLENLTTYAERIHVTSVSTLLDYNTVDTIMLNLAQQIGLILRNKDKLVAKSLRLFVVPQVAGATDDVVFTLAWMTYKE